MHEAGNSLQGRKGTQKFISFDLHDKIEDDDVHSEWMNFYGESPNHNQYDTKIHKR